MNIGGSYRAPLLVPPSAVNGAAEGSEVRPPGAEVRPQGAEKTPQGTPIDPARDSTRAREQERVRVIEESREIQKLSTRDREVRSHEQAHAAIGGRYASAPHYDLKRGPNGRYYAESGHVNIDTAPVPGDPKATLEKARVVQRAALAPAEPSTQDRKVAAEARRMAFEASAELAKLQADALAAKTGAGTDETGAGADETGDGAPTESAGEGTRQPRIDISV